MINGLKRIAASPYPFVKDPSKESKYEKPDIPIFTLRDVSPVYTSITDQSDPDAGVPEYRLITSITDARYGQYQSQFHGTTYDVVFGSPKVDRNKYVFDSERWVNVATVDVDNPYTELDFGMLAVLTKVGYSVGRNVTYVPVDGLWFPSAIRLFPWDTSNRRQNMGLASIVLAAVGGGIIGEAAKTTVKLAQGVYATAQAVESENWLQALRSAGALYVQVDALT